MFLQPVNFLYYLFINFEILKQQIIFCLILRIPKNKIFTEKLILKHILKKNINNLYYLYYVIIISMFCIILLNLFRKYFY